MTTPASTVTPAISGLEPAEGGLSLVQDLLNSRVPAFGDRPDPLAALDAAAEWVAKALACWSQQTGQPEPRIALTPRDLAPLGALREQVRGWVDERREGGVTQAAVSVVVQDGNVSYVPAAAGATAITGLVGVELLLASRLGTLRRLKACRNERCSAVFYDRSKNSSRVWHDVAICGNAANLRASRARRKAAQAAE